MLNSYPYARKKIVAIIMNSMLAVVFYPQKPIP
jgi:hypothetical protein